MEQLKLEINDNNEFVIADSNDSDNSDESNDSDNDELLNELNADISIQSYCKEMKITMGELAKELGISPSYMSKLKYGQIYPNKELEIKLAERGIKFTPDPRPTYLQRNEQLVRENKYLKRQLSILKDSVIPKIEELLIKMGNKYIKKDKQK